MSTNLRIYMFLFFPNRYIGGGFSLPKGIQGVGWYGSHLVAWASPRPHAGAILAQSSYGHLKMLDPRHRGFQGHGSVPFDEIYHTVLPKGPERYSASSALRGSCLGVPRGGDLRPLWHFVRCPSRAPSATWYGVPPGRLRCHTIVSAVLLLNTTSVTTFDIWLGYSF